jgi:hypothetical protein
MDGQDLGSCNRMHKIFGGLLALLRAIDGQTASGHEEEKAC